MEQNAYSRTSLAHALAAHRARLAACAACELGAGVRPIVSEARDARVMLVGQAPGRVEAGGGRAFAGRSGATLFGWLAQAGLDEAVFREHVYIAAVTRCFPGPHPSGRGDRVPSPAERARCRRWLDDELRIIRPELLVLVGRLAIDSLLGNAPLDRVIGTLHELEHPGGRSAAIALPHPSGASSWVHQPGNRERLHRSLALLGDHPAIRELVRGMPRAPSRRGAA
ncbi:MAG TPA: uracil-DNA glycosylase family protein [Gemmatimonadaceae bacterium]|jgi:uracil-DNA glycosylase|nr:uracil-DNA glycosylase family protein [Gemmatimonadaceae bacterium]